MKCIKMIFAVSLVLCLLINALPGQTQKLSLSNVTSMSDCNDEPNSVAPESWFNITLTDCNDSEPNSVAPENILF
jgi:hypothetical protein